MRACLRIFVVSTIALLLAFTGATVAHADQSQAMTQLGKHLFSSKALSNPVGQSCASCHAANTGFTSPDSAVNAGGAVFHGAVAKRFGNRKPPGVAYVTFAAPFAFSGGRAGGGTFWDGRATGALVTAEIFPGHWGSAATAQFEAALGPAVDQAMGPLLNDLEQNLKNDKQLCQRLRLSMPLGLWAAAWGEPLVCQTSDRGVIHQRIAFAIAYFEASGEVNKFNSRWDKAVAEAVATTGSVTLPLAGLTAQQNLGHQKYIANCASFCHQGTVEHKGSTHELFTRPAAAYVNIGVPRNDENPFYKMNRVKDDSGAIINPAAGAWVDLGLGGRDEDGVPGADFPGQEGAFKVPTLRNVDKRPKANFIKAYTHNGYFKSLESLVHFYNTRDLKPTCEEVLGTPFDPAKPMVMSDGEAMMLGCWPQAEVANRINGCGAGAHCKVVPAVGESLENYCDNPANARDLGNLCLTPGEERALVAFLKTLSDS